MLIIERKDGSIYVRASSMLNKNSLEESKWKHEYQINVNGPIIRYAVMDKLEMQKDILSRGQSKDSNGFERLMVSENQ